MIMLLASTALLSCSVPDMINDPSMDIGGTGNTLVITGTVSDISDDTPLEDIKLTLHATEMTGTANATSGKATSYTDNKGMFSLRASGFTGEISCIVTAEDLKGTYKSGRNEIPLVRWDMGYNMKDGVFYINDCDFHLEKSKK